MMSVLGLLLAIFKAIPVLKECWDELLVLYISQKIESMKKENIEAIRKAIYEQNQIPLEEAFGNPNAGKPSGIPGTQIVDGLPGVGSDPK